MKGSEIKNYMKKGKLYVKYLDEICFVVYSFRHTTWFIREDGKLQTKVPHKFLTFYKLVEGDCTLKPCKRLKRFTPEWNLKIYEIIEYETKNNT